MCCTVCLCPVKAYPLTLQALLGFAHGMLCCLEVLCLEMQLCLRIARTLTCRGQLLCYLQSLASLQGFNLATHTLMLRLQSLGASLSFVPFILRGRQVFA